jgi:hypothetical protein
VVVNELEEIIYEEERLLISAIDQSVDQVEHLLILWEEL